MSDTPLQEVDMDQSMDRVSSVFRNAAAMPDTATARRHHAAMIRASNNVGYSKIARACKRDTSWVCRWLQGEGRINLAELLSWLDVCDLQITERDAEKAEDIELLQILLRKVAANLEKRAAPIDGAVTLDADEYRALLALAKRGIAAMQAEAQP